MRCAQPRPAEGRSLTRELTELPFGPITSGTVRNTVRLVTGLLLALSIGLHWSVLQTVAWTGMFVGFVQTGSFSEAISKTLDGQHPCRLCKVIKQGRAEEQQRTQEQSTKPGSKLDAAIVWEPAEFVFLVALEPPPRLEFSALSRGEAPPKPRPRGLLSIRFA